MRVLFVDDEPNVLEGYRRQLRKAFEIETAGGGAEALDIISKSEPFAVIVTDMQMPTINGIELLKKVSILSPNSVRVMLTGNADQQTAANALNEGHIFRFLTKPCSPVTMEQTLNAGIVQYQLVTAEKELLEKTLLGSIGILVDLLSLSEPQLFARGKKLRDFVMEVAKVLHYPNPWELEIAALLSQIGSLTIPPEILLKERGHLTLSAKEQELLARVPESGSNLLAKIPRLGNVAQIILYQNSHYESNPSPSKQLPVGSRILKILADLLDLEAGNMPRSVAFRMLCTRKGIYDPEILQKLRGCYFSNLSAGNEPASTGWAYEGQDVLKKGDSSSPVSSPKPEETGNDASPIHPPKPLKKWEIAFKELLVGDTLAENLNALDGSLLLAAGNTITDAVLERLKNFAQYKGIKEPVIVTNDETVDSSKLAA